MFLPSQYVFGVAGVWRYPSTKHRVRQALPTELPLSCKYNREKSLVFWVLLAGDMRLAHRLTTIVPAMPLAHALATTRIPHVAGRTGARTAIATRPPCGPLHHPVAEVG